MKGLAILVVSIVIMYLYDMYVSMYKYVISTFNLNT